MSRPHDGVGGGSPDLFAGRASGERKGNLLHKSATEPSEASKHAWDLHRCATEPKSTCEAVETGYLSPSPSTRRRNPPDTGGYMSPSPDARRRRQADSFARPFAELRTPLPSLFEGLESDSTLFSSPTVGRPVQHRLFPEVDLSQPRSIPGPKAVETGSISPSPTIRRRDHPRSRSAEAATLISKLNELSAPIDCPPPSRLRGGADNQLQRSWTDPSSIRSTRMNEAAESGYLSPSPGAVRRGTELRRMPTDPETRRRLPSLLETPEHASTSPPLSYGDRPMAHSAPQRMQRLQLNIALPPLALSAYSSNSNPSPPSPRSADVVMPLELGSTSLKATLATTTFLKIDEEQHEAQDENEEVQEDCSDAVDGNPDPSYRWSSWRKRYAAPLTRFLSRSAPSSPSSSVDDSNEGAARPFHTKLKDMKKRSLDSMIPE